MGIKLTVDLAECIPSDLAKAAKFMLEYAGFKDPSTGAENSSLIQQQMQRSEPGASLVPPMGSLGEEVHHDVPPAQAFASTVAHGGLALNVDPLPEMLNRADVDAEANRVVVSNTPLPPPPPGIEVDSQGVPWDSRIHAGSRAKIADGTWRQRRNLDPAVLTTVMAELRATMGVERRAPTPPTPPVPAAVFAPVPPVPPVPGVVEPVMDYPLDTTSLGGARVVEVPPVPFAGSAVPPAPPSSSTPSAPVSAGAATVASPGSATPPAPPPSGAPAPTFPQLMQRITAAFTQKTLSKAQIDEAMAKVGLNSLPMLASRPDLVGDVATALGIAL